MKKMIKEIYKRMKYATKWIIFYHKFKKVGHHTNIVKPLIVRNVKNVIIGDYVFSEPGLRIETYDKHNGNTYKPKIVIGNGVVMSQFVEIVATETLIIEDNVSIGQFAMINTSVHGYLEKDVPIIKQNLISAPIRIGEGTSIGMGACILPGADIGKFCYIGANTVINKKIPDYTVVSPQKPRMATLPYSES